eukprot:815836_1
MNINPSTLCLQIELNNNSNASLKFNINKAIDKAQNKDKTNSNKGNLNVSKKRTSKKTSRSKSRKRAQNNASNRNNKNGSNTNNNVTAHCCGSLLRLIVEMWLRTHPSPICKSTKFVHSPTVDKILFAKDISE